MSKSARLIILLILFNAELANSQLTDLQFTAVSTNCYFNTGGGHFIINNADEFAKLTVCSSVDVAFEYFTLIGIQGSSPGHFIPIVDIRVRKDSIDKKILIEVAISGGESCNCRVMKPRYIRFFYIDKISAEYKFEFNYKII